MKKYILALLLSSTAHAQYFPLDRPLGVLDNPAPVVAPLYPSPQINNWANQQARAAAADTAYKREATLQMMFPGDSVSAGASRGAMRDILILEQSRSQSIQNQYMGRPGFYGYGR